MLNYFHEYISCPDCFKFRHLNSVKLENVHHPLKALCPLMNLTVFLNSQAYLSTVLSLLLLLSTFLPHPFPPPPHSLFTFYPSQPRMCHSDTPAKTHTSSHSFLVIIPTQPMITSYWSTAWKCFWALSSLYKPITTLCSRHLSTLFQSLSNQSPWS